MEEDKLLGEIGKNAVEKVRISQRIYRGHTFIDIRQFWMDDQGDWRPSKSGVTVALKHFDEFADAIASAKSQIAGEIESAQHNSQRGARA